MALTEEGRAWLRAWAEKIDIEKMRAVLAEPRSVGMGRPRDMEVVEEMRRIFQVPGLDAFEGEESTCATCGLAVVVGKNVAAKRVDVVLCPVCTVVFSAMTGTEPTVADGTGPGEAGDGVLEVRN